MGSWIILVALLAPLSIAAPPDPQYILLVPAVVQSNTTNEACLQLLQLNETVSVNIALEYNVDRISLWEGTVDKKHFSQCFVFTVPPAGSNSLAYIVFSAEGSLIRFHERRSVAVRNTSTVVLVQTDKPVYKPGQKVLFRVVSMDKDLKPVNEMYRAIYIQDPQGNRIIQWLDQTPSNGILQLEHVIIQGAMLGYYQIIVEKPPNYNTYHGFSLEEYMLPKYKVDLKTPERISPSDEEFPVDVSALYTFGQPVQGTVQIRVCRHRYYDPRCNRDSNGICEAVSAQLDKNGRVSKTIRTKAYHLYTNMNTQRFYYVSLSAEAVVTEKGTGIQISQSSFISVTQAKKTIVFENVDPYYRRGLPLTGQLKVNDEDGAPLPNGLIILEFDGQVVANFTTDNNGSAQFSIPTSNLYEPRYKLRAFYEPDQCTEYGWLDTYKPEAIHYVQRYFSTSSSFMKIEPVLRELPCDKREAFLVHYILNKVENVELPSKIHFYYLMMTNGKIVDGGEHLVSTRAGRYSTFSISLMIDQKSAPRARLLVYTVLPHGELIADSISFEVEKCFRNKVSLQFSEKEALPASNIGLHLKAAANSLCALRAVDKSVLLLRPGDDLTPESVYSRLPYEELYGYYYNGLDLEDTPKEPCVELKNTFFNGQYYIPVNVTDDGNVYDVFKGLGLKAFTNSPLQKPVVCQSGFECKKISPDYPEDVPRLMDEAKVAFSAGAGGRSTLRTYFPETSLWKLLFVDSSGKANLSYIMPDTITEWEANAFCMNDDIGFGLSGRASVIGFQAFFVEPAMPYSTIRGEEFLYKINIFSYLNECSELVAELEESPDFQAEKLSPGNNSVRICPNETQSYTWRVTPRRLGMVNFTVTAEAKGTGLSAGWRDTVIKPLLVEPEGIKKEVTQSSLICVKGTPHFETITLNLPSNLVVGSETATFYVLGDILGTALKNAENLLPMPYGCAEQNIAMFLSHLYILFYLTDTKQLTEEKKSRIIGHLSAGYQRQLTFRLPDGSFSTFGSREAEGNLWLTALVYKALGQSSPVIFIDENVLNQALIWISSKQGPNGCFKSDGKIYNQALEDGGDQNTILTAHIVSSLLESNHKTSYPVVRAGLSCLDTASDGRVTSTLENALLAHTYGLAGNAAKQKHFLDLLMKSATRNGGLLYWEREKRPTVERFASFYPRASSLDILMTSYALLAWLNRPNLSQEDLTTGSQIARWLVRNQNSLGGFSSTQDTPVALLALSRFGNLTFTKDAENTVEITGTSFKKVFQVTNSNSVLLQQAELPNIPGNYTVQVKGSGCVTIQTSQKYNINSPAHGSGFALTVRTKNASCAGDFLPRFDIELKARYTGERNTSNMVIIDIKMLSGFVPVSSSLQQLQDKVMRTEVRNDHVFLYLESVSSKEITLTLTLEESHPVSKSKPASVRITDFYETDLTAHSEYNTPCRRASA